MIPTIGTKKVGNKWFCYGTINGYDVSFEGITHDYVYSQMMKYLADKRIPTFKRSPVEYYEATRVEKWKPSILLNGIDFNPIG